MKNVYPVVLTPCDNGEFVVYLPDFENYTEGKDISDAIRMARDAMGLLGITYEDEKKALPDPSDISSIIKEENQLVTLVDVDFTAYRKANDKKTVRKNVTVPGWLCAEAEKAGINFSQALVESLRLRLGM